MSIFDRAHASAQYIQAQAKKPIDVVVVLGSGLGEFANTLENSIRISYDDIPDFVRSTVEGHQGRLVIGTIGDKTVAVMQGRFHYYEGYSLDEVTLPIRAFGVMGVKSFIVTNAAGGINPNFTAGSLMLIKDHINMMFQSPLRGSHDDRLGARFPDMTEVYSREYQRIAQKCAGELGLRLESGTYLALQGPNYETPAEIRMLRVLGGDARRGGRRRRGQADARRIVVGADADRDTDAAGGQARSRQRCNRRPDLPRLHGRMMNRPRQHFNATV